MKDILFLFHSSKLQLYLLSHCRITSWITKRVSEKFGLYGYYSLKQISIKVSLVWFCSPQNFQPIDTMGHDSNCRLKAGENFPTFFSCPKNMYCPLVLTSSPTSESSYVPSTTTTQPQHNIHF